MKQAKWLLLVVVGILMVLPGCDRLGDNQTYVAGTVGDKLVVPILAGETIAVGNINMWSDRDSVHIDYILDQAENPADQWYLSACNAHIEVRTKDFPMKKGDPNTGAFALQSGDISHRTEYKFSFPAGNWKESAYVATHSAVCQLTGEEPPEKNGNSAWAGPYKFPGKKSSATLFAYEFIEVGGGEWHWEAAWSATELGQLPFSGSDGATYVTHAIGTPTSEELYAGSTRCGTVTITDDVVRGKGHVYVTYRTDNGWYTRSCNAEVALGAAGIPQVDGNPTPDQFRYRSGALDPYLNEYTITFPYKSGVVNIIIAAHADVGLYY